MAESKNPILSAPARSPVELSSVSVDTDDSRRAPWRRVATLCLALLALAPVVYRICWRADPPETSASPGAEIVNIHYMAWGNPQQLETERAIIAQFNKKCAAEGKNIRVELFMPPAGGYPQRLLMMLASGTAPDVARVDQYNFSAMAAKGYFRDLGELADGDPTFNRKDFHPVAMHENFYNGRMYGLNVLFGGLVCYYNKDLFRRSGLHDPYELWKEGNWNWAAFDDAAARLTTRDADGHTTCYGYSVYIVANGPNCPPPSVWALWLWREGGNFLTPDFSRCALDSPESIRGIQRMRDMVYRYRVCPSPAQSATNLVAFETGNVGMYIDFAGLAPRYRDVIRDFDWDIAPTPSDPGNSYTMVKGNQLVITQQSKHPREAWEWVKYLTGPEAERYICGDNYRRSVPTRLDLLRSKEYLDAKQRPFHIDVFVDLIDRGRSLPIDESWFTWTTTAHRSMDRLYVDSSADTVQTVRAVSRAADDEIAREHERYRRYQRAAEAGGAKGAAGATARPTTGEGVAHGE